MRFLQDSVRVLLALWIALAPVAAHADMLLTGAGVKASGVTPVAISYVSNNNNTISASSYTFTSQNIGATASARLVCVVLTAQASPSITISSFTIGGSNANAVSGAFVVTSTSGVLSDIRCLGVAQATSSATIVVTFNAAVTRAAIAVYNITSGGSGPSVSTGANNSTNSNVNTLTQSATIPASGGAILGINIHSSTAGATTPTNLSSDNGLTYGNTIQQVGNNASSSGSVSVGYSWAGTAADAALSIATFSP